MVVLFLRTLTSDKFQAAKEIYGSEFYQFLRTDYTMARQKLSLHLKLYCF